MISWSSTFPATVGSRSPESSRKRSISSIMVTVSRNTLTIDGDDLVIVPRGLDKLWGFRRRIVVPLSRIVEVRVEERPHHVPKGWRGPGLDTGWKLSGTFHPHGERHYWNFSGIGPALNIKLDGSGRFSQLYLSVGDAEQTHKWLAGAAAAHRGPRRAQRRA